MKCACGDCNCTVETKDEIAVGMAYCSDTCKTQCGASRSCDCGHPQCKG